MLSSILELSQEYVRVAEVAIGSSLRGSVSELLGYLQALRVVLDGSREVS